MEGSDLNCPQPSPAGGQGALSQQQSGGVKERCGGNSTSVMEVELVNPVTKNPGLVESDRREDQKRE